MEGTQNGKTVRLKDKELPVYKKYDIFGDFHIQLQVKIPEKLSEAQKALFEQHKETQ